MKKWTSSFISRNR